MRPAWAPAQSRTDPNGGATVQVAGAKRTRRNKRHRSLSEMPSQAGQSNPTGATRATAPAIDRRGKGPKAREREYTPAVGTLASAIPGQPASRMKRVRIRQYEPADMRRLLKLEAEAFAQDAWQRDLLDWYAQKHPGLFLVALVEARIAGYCIARPRGSDAADIDSIAVLTRYRRQGIATALMKAALSRLRRRRITSIGLMVRRDNIAAIAFYKRFGFVRRRTVPDYYEDGTAAWRMTTHVGSGLSTR